MRDIGTSYCDFAIEKKILLNLKRSNIIIKKLQCIYPPTGFVRTPQAFPIKKKTRPSGSVYAYLSRYTPCR